MSSRSSNNASRPKPYQRAQGASSSKAAGTHQARKTSSTNNNVAPVVMGESLGLQIKHYPPLPPGEESQLDIIREMVKRKYPLFEPRNSADLIVMASSVYDGPGDHATICAIVDRSMEQWVSVFNLRDVQEAGEMFSRKHDLEMGRIAAKEMMGLKPRQGWEVCIRAMPSCPKYSLRLWAASSSMRQFGMDFVVSATGEPVNLSDRFHVYRAEYFLGSDRVMLVPPFGKGLIPNAQVGAGDELYVFREEQGVTIVDTACKNQSRPLTFKVPKHPAKIPVPGPPPNADKFDVIHFSMSK